MTADAEGAGFWDDELAELDAKATAIFGEEAVLEALQSVRLPVGEMTLANILDYRQAVKAELRRMVRPN